MSPFFFLFQRDFVFIPDCSQTWIYLQIYYLAHGLPWPFYFRPFPICCMPISYFRNNSIQMWFVGTPITFNWGRWSGEKESWNTCLELGLQDFVKFIWLACRGFGWALKVRRSCYECVLSCLETQRLFNSPSPKQTRWVYTRTSVYLRTVWDLLLWWLRVRVTSPHVLTIFC